MGWTPPTVESLKELLCNPLPLPLPMGFKNMVHYWQFKKEIGSSDAFIKCLWPSKIGLIGAGDLILFV